MSNKWAPTGTEDVDVVMRLVDGMTRQLRRGLRPAALMAATDLIDLAPELGLPGGSTSERANELAGAIVRAIGAMAPAARDAASVLLGIGGNVEMTLTERRRLAAEALHLQPETFRRHRQRELLTDVARNVVLATRGFLGTDLRFSSAGPAELLRQQRDPRTVLLLTGGDGLLRDEIESYLVILGLRPMRWDQGVRAGAGATNLLDVMHAAIDIAQAVVVVLEGDPSSGTPAQNLLLEAGFALGVAAERTVILTAGPFPVPSDLQGTPLLWNSQVPMLREAVTRRLMSFGCPVVLTKRSIDARDLKSALDPDHDDAIREPIGSAAALRLATRIQDQLPEIRQVDALQEASRRDRLLVFAQPVIDLQSNEVVARELSVRLDDADAPGLAPSEIRPLAERWGIIGEIDLQLGRNALQFASLGYAVWSKLSVATFADKVTISVLYDEIRRSNVDPTLVTFEVTENGFSRPEVWEAVKAFQKLGCNVAIDDFGTGHSSLARLRTMNASLIILDRSVIERARDDASNQMIVSSTAELARALNMRAVAVGVMDERTAAAVRALGVELAMGQWLGAAEPADPTRWLR